MGVEEDRSDDTSNSVPTIPNSLDVRQDTLSLSDPAPVGPALAVDVTEILRRGFKSLSVDEQAVIIAAYLSAQKSQLSVYDTPDEVKEKMTKLEIESNNNKTKNIMAVGGFAVAIIAFIGLTGVLAYTVTKQGLLSDSTVFQGVLTMVQEVFKVVTSGGKY